MVLATVCISGAGRSEDGSKKPLPFRCLYEGRTAEFTRVQTTGNKWLDTRIRSERSFLKSLFRTEADIVLYGDDAPRNVWVTQRPTGEVTIAFKASWLVERCTGQEDHKTAQVAYTLAHAYAHAVQARKGCELAELDRERHADMLAGWYLGRRNIATLKGKAPLNPTLAPLLFAQSMPFLNEQYEHGTPEMRSKALAEGFRSWRADRMSINKFYRHSLKMVPPSSVGLVGADAKIPGPLRAAMNQLRLKVGCKHPGPCKHKIPCTHPKPCTHKIACQHLDPCDHRTPCVHRIDCVHTIPCVHKQPCVHRVQCVHKIPCVHRQPCVHRKHRCDFLHEFDLDANGYRIPCVHEVPCRHFLHRFDYAHNFDYQHDWDFAHEFDYAHEHDTKHEYDLEHEFDTLHDGHPRHEFDLAHEWDPVHDHDLAHESDPLHAYDIELRPKPGSKPNKPK